MIVKRKFKKLPLTTSRVFLTNDSCNDPIVKLVAKQLLIYIIENPNQTITYKELTELCDNKVHYRFSLNGVLGEISELCRLNHLPLVSAIVCNKKTKLPGAGFFGYFFPQLSEKDWKVQFEKCKAEIFSCTEWQDFIEIFE